MANYIKNLKEDNEDITYPVTKAGAVYLNSGTDLEAKVGTLVSAEEIAVTSPSTPLVGTNMINDKAVTSDKIDWTTMNVVEPFIVADRLTSDLSVASETITTVQTLTLPAGKWFVTYMIRGFYTSSAVSLTQSFLYAGDSNVYAVACNVANSGSDARYQVTGGTIVEPTSTTTYTSRINTPAASTVSNTAYLYAMRVS